MENVIVNHLMFPHYICAFGGSCGVRVLPRCLNICCGRATEHESVFNCKATVGVVVPCT